MHISAYIHSSSCLYVLHDVKTLLIYIFVFTHRGLLEENITWKF